MTSTPLSATNPETIEELLDRDPLSLTEEEIDKNVEFLVKALRAEREVWAADVKANGGKTSGSRVKKTQKEAVKDKLAAMGTAKIDLSKIKF